MPADARRNAYPLVLGGLVLLVVAAVVLAVQLAGGNDEGDDRAVATAPANVPAAPPQTTDQGAVAGQRSSSDSQAQLRAGGVSLLPAPAGGLAAAAGQRVTGQRLVVVELQGRDRVYVGRRPGDRERVLVELPAGGSYVPNTNDRIALEGTVRDERVVAETVTPQGAKTGGKGGVGASGDASSNAPPGDRP